MAPLAPPKGSRFMRNWFAIEALPIVGIVAFVTTGATFLLYRSAKGPDIQWTYKNNEPWQTIQPDQNVKLINVNQKYTGGNWKREHW